MALTAGEIQVILNGNATGVTRAFQSAEKSIGSLTGVMRSAEMGSRMVAAGLAAAVAAAVGLGIKAVSLAGQIEQTTVAFTSLLGSAGQAKDMVQELQQFAARTPFQFQGLADSARLLVTMGFNAQQVVPAMQTVSDAVAAAGGGQAELMGVARALGQIQAKGKVSAEELMQLAERGIPAQKILQQELGLTGEQVADIGNQGISAERGIAALLKGLEERFKGTAERQSQTILGMWSTVKDNVSLTLVPLGEAIVGAFNLKDVAQNAIKWLEHMRANLEMIRDAIEAGGVRAAVERLFSPKTQLMIIGIAGAIAGALIPAFWGVVTAIGAALAPLLPFLAAGAAVAALAFLIYKNWKEIGNVLADAWDVARAAGETAAINIERAWNSVKRVVYGVINSILDAVAPLLDWLPGRLGASFDAMRKTIKSKLTDVGDNMDQLSGRLEENHKRMATAIDGLSGSWDDLKTSVVGNFSAIKKSIDPSTEALDAFYGTQKKVEEAAGSGGDPGKAGSGVAGAMQKQAEAVDMFTFKLRQLDNQWKMYTTTTQAASDSVKYLTAQKENLLAKLNVISPQVELLKTQFEAMDVATKGWAEESIKLKEQLDGATITQLELQKSMDDTTKSIIDQTEASRLAALGISSITDEIKTQTLAVSAHVAEVAKWLNDVAGLREQSGKVADMLAGGNREQVLAAAQVISLTQSVGSAGGEFGKLSNADIAAWMNAPGLAAGGTVMSPGMALVGERGPEILSLQRGATVTPMSKAGNTTIIYQQNAPVYGIMDFEQKVKSTMRDAIQGGAFRGVISTP